MTTLPGTIPGLLRRGAPVVEAGESGITGCVGVAVPSSIDPARLCVRWEGRAASMETGITGGTALDLTDPAGRDIAVRWLAERGHDAHRYRDEPDALAWCVRSVAAGGGMLAGVLTVSGDESNAEWAAHAERCRLRMGYAVREPDGSLRLPPLPESA